MVEKVALWPVERLIPYAKNSRTHSDEQVAEIAQSIRAFGWTNPILADKTTKEIIAGHARLRAALQLGLKLVPVIELSHLSPALRRAYVIADNKLALKAGWDLDILKDELHAIIEDGVDPTWTGFDAAEIDVIEKGWDAGKGEEAEPDGDDDHGTVMIKVYVPAADAEEIMALLKSMAEESGVEGIRIAKA
jgi:ParB-like chromosome segregation protein Spo0J